MTRLAGRRIMVVEDMYYLAMDVKKTLETAGATVVGPFADAEGALGSLRQDAPDCAVLDVNLGGGASFDLARTLNERAVPFLFFTGYDQSAIPAEFSSVPRLEKPVDGVRLVEALADCCRGRRASP